MLMLFAGVVLPAAAQSITGHVFEDQGYTGGSGRNFATAGGGVTGARVELYATAGTAHFICAVTTPAGGVYTLNAANGCALANGNTYTVRVVNSSVVSNYAGGGTAGLVPVQTYGTSCANCGAVPTAITNYVGGQVPANVDAGNGAAGAAYPANSQTLATVSINGTHPAASLIDFGFNFFTIVNTNASGQGSLAQFVTNVNALTGASNVNAIFMISNGAVHNGMNATYASQLTATANGSVFRITAGSMPTVTAGGTIIDATDEITNIGSNPNTGTYGPAGITLGAGSASQTLSQWAGPCVEIMSNAGDQQWQFTGTSDTVKGFAFAQFALYLIGSSDTAQDNMVGMHADETFTGPTIPAEATYYGIQLGAGTNITVNHNLVAVNNSGIRHEALNATGDIIEYNDVDLPSGGQTNTFDGILMVGPGTFTGENIQYNYVHNMQGGGIEIGFSGSPNTTLTSETVQYNTVQYNGWVLNGTGPKSSTYTYSAPSTEPLNIAVWGVASGSTVFVKNNLVSYAGGVGVLIENAYGFTISQNSIYQNGHSASFTAAQGPGISLYNSNVDPNGFGTSAGITPNTGTLNPSMPNNFMNYPVITLATYIGTNLRVKGYVGGSTNPNLAIANAKVEVFIADNTDNNQNGNIFLGDGLNVPHGEGKTFVETFNADSQGLFDVTIPASSFPAGVTVTAGTTVVTSTATDAVSGSTSEFGPNQLVQSSALNIQGYVYYDVNHSGSYNSGESWQNGAAVYAVLWDTTKNLQAAVGGTTIGAQTIAFGVATDTGFFSFDNVTPGDTYQLLLTTAAPAAGGIYASLPGVSIPSGWIMVSPNTASVSIPTSATSAQIMVQNFGLFHGLKVSGKVFKDNGIGGGTANDGHLNGTEPGLPNIILVAKDSFTVSLDQETTDGGGNYTLWLPAIDSSLNTVTSVTFTLSQVGGYTATGYDVGTLPAGSTYSTTTFVLTFTPNWAANTSCTGVNFGFIQSGNIFAPNGQQTTVPGSFAVYAHQYTSVTGGTVIFTETPAVSQPNYFSEILYNDTTCSGNLATATYLPWGATGSVTIAAGGGKVCLFMKEMVSTAASFGMQNAITITATFSYTGGTVASTTLTVTDLTTLDTRTSGDLQLVKSSYIDATCANLNIVSSPAYVTTTTSAQHPNCIQYQIQATNTGASALSGLTINDTAPPYTSLQTGTHSPASSVGASCTGLTVGAITTAGGAVQATFTGTMPAGCVATLVYEVQLN